MVILQFPFLDPRTHEILTCQLRESELLSSGMAHRGWNATVSSHISAKLCPEFLSLHFSVATTIPSARLISIAHQTIRLSGKELSHRPWRGTLVLTEAASFSGKQGYSTEYLQYAETKLGKG